MKKLKLNEKAAKLLVKDLDAKALEAVNGGMACGKNCGVLATTNIASNT